MLEASRHLLPYKVVPDIVYTMIYYRQPILFYFSLFCLLPLKFTLGIQNFKDIFSFSDIWTLILIFYLFIFLFLILLPNFNLFSISNCDLLIFSNPVLIILILFYFFLLFFIIFNFHLKFIFNIYILNNFKKLI